MSIKICLILSLFIYSSFSAILPANYQQCDLRWKDTTIGFGSKTICENGSLLTSVAAMVDSLHSAQGNLDFIPPLMNEWLKENGGFEDDDKFVWDSLTPLGWKFEGFSEDINEIIDAFAEEKAMILQVKGTDHYVVLAGIIYSAFFVMDPQNKGEIFYRPSEILGAGIYTLTDDTIHI